MILVVAEHVEGRLRKSALELVQAGRELAQGLGTEALGLVLGSGAGGVAEELSNYLPRVREIDHAELESTRAETWTRAIEATARELEARAVLMSAGRTGLSVAPRLAMRLDAPLLEDVISLEVEDGRVAAERYVYLSRAVETVRARRLPVVVSVKPNIYPMAAAADQGVVERQSVEFDERDLRVQVGEQRKPAGGRVALEEASVVVTGGRGVGDAEGFANLVEPLADRLGAGIAATRAVVDAGWRPYAEQVGQTGKSVAPDLYIALGVSGAVQHLSGMNRSKVVVAVNKDADAPIFKASDYGIVGDIRRVVPALTKALDEEGG